MPIHKHHNNSIAILFQNTNSTGELPVLSQKWAMASFISLFIGAVYSKMGGIDQGRR